MNVVYGINKETGIMRLELREDIFEDLSEIQKRMVEELALPILQHNKKYIIAGSLALKLLGFEKLKGVNDFDFNLASHFTDQDHNTLVNLFNLTPVLTPEDVAAGVSIENFKVIPEALAWKFTKTWVTVNERNLPEQASIIVDIFNQDTVKIQDIITIHWKDKEIRVVHPSYPYSYRVRYAIDVRTTAQKYCKQVEDLFYSETKLKEFFKLQRILHKMEVRVIEHNRAIGSDRAKLEKTLELVKEEHEDLFEKVFEATLFPQTLEETDINLEMSPPLWRLKG